MSCLNNFDLIRLEAILIYLNKPKLFQKKEFRLHHCIIKLKSFCFNLSCILIIGFMKAMGKKLTDYFVHF